MKKLKIIKMSIFIILIFLFTTACTNNESQENNNDILSKTEISIAAEQSDYEKSENDPWKTVYDQKLHEIYEEYNKSKSSPTAINYDIYDLNGNGIPELIISEGDIHV